MANQINPAQHGETASSHHPATVSTRFPSSAPETGADQNAGRAILFLMDKPELSWITHDLCQILTQRGYNSGLCQLNAPPMAGHRNTNKQPIVNTGWYPPRPLRP